MDIKRAVEFTEKVFLVLIALFTVVAMAQEVMLLVANRKVELKDLLLMFIYAEVLGMLGAFYTSRRPPGGRSGSTRCSSPSPRCQG